MSKTPTNIPQDEKDQFSTTTTTFQALTTSDGIRHKNRTCSEFTVEYASPPKYKNKFLQVCSFILIMELCERLAYYTFQSNLAVYMKKWLGKSASTASMLSGLFNTFVYVTPLAGAYVADAILGRYQAIVIFSSFYAIGLFMLAISAWPTLLDTYIFFIGLFVFISFGAGGIKSNVVTLGADQFDPTDPNELKQMGSFFNWFYWMINGGTIIATALIGNFALNGAGAITEEYSFPVSFFLAGIFFSLSLMIFVLGKKRYVRKPPSGSSTARFISIVSRAAKQTIQAKLIIFGFILYFVGIFAEVIAVVCEASLSSIVKNTLDYLCLVSILGGSVILIWSGRNVNWVKCVSPCPKYDSSDIKGAWELLRMFPYLGFMIPFWLMHSVLHGPWTNQGCQMDTRVFSKNSQYNPGSWSLWLAVSICLLIPLFDWYVYPFVGRLIGRPNGPTALQKIGAGYVFGIVAMILSGLIEIHRRNSKVLDIRSRCDNVTDENPRMLSSMSLWFQVLPYVLLGISEMLCNITSYDLFYNQVPKSMKSACQGLNLFTDALGAVLNVVVQSILKSGGWITDNLNDGHQEVYYFAVAGFVTFMLIPFIYVSSTFEYKNLSQEDEDDRLSRLSSSDRHKVAQVSNS